MLVRPSLVLQIMLKPEDYSEDAAEELKRSYIYLAQSIVKEQQADDLAEGNVMRLSIRLMRPYWDIDDSKAQELWEGVMPQWLCNVTRNMSTAMHNYNTVQHPEGAGDVRYDWADYELDDNVTIRVKVDADNRITPEMPGIVERVRELMNQGAFGDGEIALVRVPSRASYEAQLAAEIEERRRRAEQQAALEQAEAAARQESPSEETPGGDAGEDGDDFEGSADVIAESEADAGDAVQDEPLSFEIDFGTWGIEYQDGSIVEYDASQA